MALIGSGVMAVPEDEDWFAGAVTETVLVDSSDCVAEVCPAAATVTNGFPAVSSP